VRRAHHALRQQEVPEQAGHEQVLRARARRVGPPPRARVPPRSCARAQRAALSRRRRADGASGATAGALMLHGLASLDSQGGTTALPAAVVLRFLL